MTLRWLPALPLVAVLLAGCGSDPADVRREQVAALTEAANQRDALALRSGADELLRTLGDSEDLSAAQAERLVQLVRAVRTHADVIDADLLKQRQAQAEAEAERVRLEQERTRLEEERRKAEEAARSAEEQREDGKGERKGKGDKDKDEDD
jgi:hypothetical protein